MAGKYASLGSTVGGVAGSAFGPLGTAIGGALGGIGGWIGDLFSDKSAAEEAEDERKRAEKESFIHNMASRKLDIGGDGPVASAVQVQSAPAAPTMMAQQSSLPGVGDPAYYQKLAQQKYRSAMGA